MATEIYPMPMFPTLSVRDADASARWYEALGFEHVFTMPDAAGRPQLVHLRWTKYADVLLRQGPSPVLEGRDRGVALTFALATDQVATIAERARALGSTIVAEPTVQPWNARDVSIADPDGHLLVFTFGPVDVAMTFDEVTDRARRA